MFSEHFERLKRDALLRRERLERVNRTSELDDLLDDVDCEDLD